jgi:hypothetical protein
MNALENTGEYCRPNCHSYQSYVCQLPRLHTETLNAYFCLTLLYTMFFVVNIFRELLQSRILVKLMSECKTGIIVFIVCVKLRGTQLSKEVSSLELSSSKGCFIVLVPRTKTIKLRESCFKEAVTPCVFDGFGLCLVVVSWGRDSSGWVLFSSLPLSARLWGPRSFLSSGYNGRSVKLITHLHIGPEIKNVWSFPSTLSICVQGQFCVSYCGVVRTAVETLK